MIRNRSATEAGFTIIEIMFVLVIGGMIMLLIFEALPGLERNSRNNRRRQDAQTVLAAISHYELNNSGNIPGTGSNFLQYSKLTIYDITQVKYIPGDVATTTGVNVYAETPTLAAQTEHNTNIDVMNIYDFRKCSSSTPGTSTNQGAGYNDIVALYAIETSSGSASQCEQL